MNKCHLIQQLLVHTAREQRQQKTLKQQQQQQNQHQ